MRQRIALRLEDCVEKFSERHIYTRPAWLLTIHSKQMRTEYD
jgi:hypothetical protein